MRWLAGRWVKGFFSFGGTQSFRDLNIPILSFELIDIGGGSWSDSYRKMKLKKKTPFLDPELLVFWKNLLILPNVLGAACHAGMQNESILQRQNVHFHCILPATIGKNNYVYWRKVNAEKHMLHRGRSQLLIPCMCLF